MGETVPLTGPKFLNSGFIVGPADKLVEVMTKMVRVFDEGYVNDQTALGLVMRDNPDLVTLDYGMMLVSTLYGLSMEKGGKPMFTWDQGSGTWYNHGIDRTACFLHSTAGGLPFKALFFFAGLAHRPPLTFQRGRRSSIFCHSWSPT